MLKVFGKNNLDIYNDMSIDILLYHAPRIMTNTYKKSVNEITEIGKKYYFNCTCGYAMLDANNKFKICVTRKNSCLGLLTHELGHICQLDLGIFRNNEYIFPNDRLLHWQEAVKKYFNINKKSHIGSMTEGINNGNSSIIHSMFLALEDTKTTDSLKHKYNKFYEKEFIYSIQMTCKLLKWFKYSSLNNLFIKTNENYIQDSFLLEYILLRCVYLINFDTLNIFDKKIIDDDKYVTLFLKKLINSINIIDVFINLTKNKNTMSMEYYYHT